MERERRRGQGLPGPARPGRARVTTVVRVFGTSAAGQLPILPDLYLEAERHGVEVVAPPTPEACRLLEAADPADVAAILHVTC